MDIRTQYLTQGRRALICMRRDPGTLTALLVGTAVSVGGGVAAAELSKGKTPPLPPVTPMPDPNSPSALLAKKNEQEQLAAQSGRQSTILSNDLQPTSLAQSAQSAPTYVHQQLGQ